MGNNYLNKELFVSAALFSIYAVHLLSNERDRGI